MRIARAHPALVRLLAIVSVSVCVKIVYAQFPGPDAVVARVGQAESLLAANRTADAAEQIKEAIPPEGQEATAQNWPLPEETFRRLSAVSETLTKQNAISKGLRARLLRSQTLGYHRAMLAATAPADAELRYGQWRDLRLEYMREMLLARGRWEVANSFRAEGVAAGLRPVDQTRENFWQAITMAEHSQYLDSIRDEENKYWVGLAADRLSNPAERDRLHQLLTAPDPAPRAAEAALIKKAFNGNPILHPVWRKHDTFFDSAVIHLTTAFSQAQSPDDHKRAAQDAVELARRAEKLYQWPPGPLPPQIETALAFRTRLEQGPDQLVMDGIHVLALARRGRVNEAAGMRQTLRTRILSTGPLSQDMQRQIDRLQRDITKQMELATARTVMFQPDVVQVRPSSSAPASQPEDASLQYARLAVDLSIEIAATSADPEASTQAIEAVVMAYRRLNQPLQAQEALERLKNRLGENIPDFKKAQLGFMEMWVASWFGRYWQAISIAEEMSGSFLQSNDPHASAICADALCHAFIYSTRQLGEADRGRLYLQQIQAAYPDGRYEGLIQHARERLALLQAQKPIKAASRR